MTDQSAHVCIGYGGREGVCTNPAGTPWTPLWCSECDVERRATITRQLEAIRAGFDDGGDHS